MGVSKEVLGTGLFIPNMVEPWCYVFLRLESRGNVVVKITCYCLVSENLVATREFTILLNKN